MASLRRTFALALIAAAVPVQIVPAADPAAAAVGSVSGVLYRDLDNDGLKDPNEPGVAGVVVAVGWSYGVSGSDGRYTVSFSGVQRVRVVTGWYRSQCSAENCARGAADNDFIVSKQYIFKDAVDASLTPKLDAGLLPDWPGEYPQPIAPVPANRIDVSARTSWIAAPSGMSCNRGTKAERACRRGDTAKFQVQVYNEGTTAVTKIKGRLELPSNHAFVSLDPSISPPNHPGLDLTVGAFDPVTRVQPFTIIGTLPAGASAQYVLSLTVGQTAALSPLPLPTASPFPTDVVTRVVSIAEGIANDTDSAWCLANNRTCIGAHNKQVEPDHADYAGWNVIA